MRIEDVNYYRDPRTQTAPKHTVWINEEEIQLPTTWAVCSVCNGEGKHVNPSIDAGGISSERFAEDPDFEGDYFNGVYDVTCTRCQGRTTEKVIDAQALTQTQREALQDEACINAQMDAESAAERNLGA